MKLNKSKIAILAALTCVFSVFALAGCQEQSETVDPPNPELNNMPAGEPINPGDEGQGPRKGAKAPG